MRLIGMLDSPYVRRTAISLRHLAIDFEHEALSVFSTFEAFRAINPVVKAPTLVCDDGQLLMDSSLILQYAEAYLSEGRQLWPDREEDYRADMRAVGLALAACDKSVQLVYERNLRPKEAQYVPWMSRVQAQITAALEGLEIEVKQRSEAFVQPNRQAVITSAVVWQFVQSMLAEQVPAESFPALAALSARMEDTHEFRDFPPVGPGV